ncbi:MAG TPA: formylglycine-generating enzyme family protein [Vicinamibacterales bacterium]|nr:formylglycine-generating enzyme family protein [Vicinamibacterales bacterium]
MTRRTLLRGMATAIATMTQPGFARQPSFRGVKAGDSRRLDGIDVCWCPPGRFIMGSPRSEPERRPGEDQVEVTLTRGFWMAKYETTQGLWNRVAGALPGPLTKELPAGDDLPVGNVNWPESEDFCRRLTERLRSTRELPADWEFRLPTEAQWEYACRAGTTTATAFGDSLSSKQANFKGKPYNGGEPGPSLGRAAPVGSYPPNAWGLHDMHGNTFEWCRDWYHARLPGGVDPDLRDARDTAQRSEHGDISRVRRGGAWSDEGWPCRSAFRVRFEPERRYDHIGFRVVIVEVR